MLDKKFTDWLDERFGKFSFVGNPDSKKYRFEEQIYQPKDIFTLVTDEFKKISSDYFLGHNDEGLQHYELFTSQSPEAKEISKYLLSIAKKNKQGHAKSEKVRRQHGVLESLETKLMAVPSFPEEPSDIDHEAIIDRFRQVVRGPVRMIYYCDKDGKLEALGVIANSFGGQAALADKMQDRHNVNIAQTYVGAGLLLSGIYNELQCIDSSEIDNFLAEKKMDKWPELAGTWKRDIDSLMGVALAHVQNNMPVLPWVVQSVKLCKEIQEDYITKDNGDTQKITHTSGFRFSKAAGYINNAKSYYLTLLQHTEYIKEIEKPDQFGGIYKLQQEVGTGDDLDWEASPMLRTYFAMHTETQRKVKSAFWYCAFTHKKTPGLLEINGGGTLKNAVVQLISEKAAELYNCPEKNVKFLLSGDMLNSYRCLVQNDGLVSRSYLDYLFVFYDEPILGQEMWNNFKTSFGAEKPEVKVEPKYVDPYTESGFPTPIYMAMNHPAQIYERKAFWRRLVIIRTNADNTYKQLTIEERKALSDPEVRDRAFNILMNMGKRAYEEICTQGFMDDINEIYPEIGGEYNTASEDFDEEMEEFYDSLFETKDAEGKDTIQLTKDAIIESYLTFADEKYSDGLEKRVLFRVRAMVQGNEKTRVMTNGVRSRVYLLKRRKKEEADDDSCGLRIQL